MEKLYKNIPSIEGYQISTDWEVKSIWWYNGKKKHDIIRKAIIVNSWYYQVLIKRKPYLVHRLVAHTFLWLDLNDRNMCVCHKDDNKLNNNVDNLFLGTHKENSLDMISKWRQGWFKNRWENHWAFKLTDAQVKEIRELLKLWELTQIEIWKQYWVDASHISRIKTWNRNTRILLTN